MRYVCFYLTLVLLLAASESACGLWIVGLTDNFNVSNSPTKDQNVDLEIRQAGTAANNPWKDYGHGNTQLGGEYENMVKINSFNQLEMFSGSNPYMGDIIIVSQIDLPQSPTYRLKWDQGADTDWSFARFNVRGQLVGMPDCGIMVWGSSQPGRVTLWVDGDWGGDGYFNSPTGENGLHHIEVEVDNGILKVYMDSTIDENTLPAWTVDVSHVGTGRTGIGDFSFYGSSSDVTCYLDNFTYNYVPVAQLETIDGWAVNANASDPLLFTYMNQTLHILQGLGPVFVGKLGGPSNYSTNVLDISQVAGYTVMHCQATRWSYSSTYYLKFRKLPDNAMEVLVEGNPNEVLRFQCGNIYGSTTTFKQFACGQRMTEAQPNTDGGWLASIFWPTGGVYFYGIWDADWTGGYTSSHRLPVKTNYLAQNPPITVDSEYGVLTDGSRPALRERYVIRAAINMFEAMGPIVQNPSEYRDELAEMVYFDHRGSGFEIGNYTLKWIKDVTAGKIKLYSSMQAWSDVTYWDEINPDSYRIPDHATVGSIYGTREELEEFIALGKDMGRVGLRSNYIFIGPGSWSVAEGVVRRAVDKTGSLSWYTDWASAKLLAERQETDIQTDFAPNASHHDSTGTVATGGGVVNFDAAVPGAGTLRATRQHIRGTCKAAKDAHNGPLSTEGSLSEFLMGEYMDTGDFQLYSVYRSEVGVPSSGRRYDFTPEYKLKRLHGLTGFHSIGIGPWFYYGPWESDWMALGYTAYFGSNDTLDSYRACEVLYGNGGYINFTDFVGADIPGIRKVHVLTECLTVGVAQKYYTLQLVDYVLYGKSGQWKTLDEIIRTNDTLADVQSWYKSFHIRYTNGCHVWVNRNSSVLTVTTADSRQFKLPQDGWLVYTEDGNLTAYTALGGVPQTRVDFCEDISRGIKYVNPRKSLSYKGVTKPTVWVDGKVHFVLLDPDKEFYDAFKERCGTAWTEYLNADITGPEGVRDCYVDLWDISLLSEEWLGCTDPELAGCFNYGEAQGSWVNILSDNFNATNVPTNDQNSDLVQRQMGNWATEAWGDFGGNTQPGGQYEDRVSINVNKHLQIFVGGPPSYEYEGEIVQPGFNNLPQSSHYKLTFDMKAESGSCIASFNWPSGCGGLDCGLLLRDTGVVVFYADQEWAIYRELGTTGTGENGMHHFDVTVIDGQMTIDMNHGSVSASYDISQIGTGATGIGDFVFWGLSDNTTAMLDNFVYQIPLPSSCGEPGTIYRASDIGGGQGPDCYVNFLDLAVMAEEWLNCNDPAKPASCK